MLARADELTFGGHRLRRGFRNTLFRCQKRQQDVCFHARPEFHLGEVADILHQAFHLGAAHVLVSHLAPAMEDHRFYFVAFSEELDDLIFANLIIVLGGGWPELYFLDMRTFLVLLLLVRLLVLLVEELAVIHELADRRHRVGRDFHDIQARIPRGLHRVKQRHYTQLISRFVDYTDFPGATALVDSKTATATPFCDKPTSRTRCAGCRRPFTPRAPEALERLPDRWTL